VKDNEQQPVKLVWAPSPVPAIAATPIQAKYIFLDVVGFTKPKNKPLRTSEDQTSIVQAMNSIVKTSVSRYKFYEDTDVIHKEKGMIFLPTGDGMCIALINLYKYSEYNGDIQMDIALDILKALHKYNNKTTEGAKFRVRIGLNEYRDNLVVDINSNPNIVGDGINIASRIMSLAGCNQILVGEPVLKTLREGGKYKGSDFTSYYGQVKHNYILRFYQFTKSNVTGLDVSAPKSALPLLQYKAGSYSPEATW